METSQQKHAARRALIVILYIIAGLVLVIGLILSIYFFNAPNTIQTFTFLLGQSPVLKGIISQINRLLVTFGLLLLAFTLALSGVLVALGRTLTQNLRLAERVEELEQQIGLQPLGKNNPTLP